MAVQYPCEVCSEDWPLENLVLIKYNGRLMCPLCINKMINSICSGLDELIDEEVQ